MHRGGREVRRAKGSAGPAKTRDKHREIVPAAVSVDIRPRRCHGICVCEAITLAMSQPSRHESPAPPDPATPDEFGAALHRARASFHSLLDISPELVLVHRDGQVAYLNPASVRALGLSSADERIGAPIADAFHEEDRSVVESRVVAPAANSTHETFGLRWLGKGGTYRTTEAAAAPIELDGSAAVGVT
jgi:PAS domain S-box-containing protein